MDRGSRNRDGGDGADPRQPARGDTHPAPPERAPEAERPGASTRSEGRPRATPRPDSQAREGSRPPNRPSPPRDPSAPAGPTRGREPPQGRRKSAPKPVPVASAPKRPTGERPPEPPPASTRPRPRRLPTSQYDDPPEDRAAPETAPMPDADWDERLERRRELRRTLRSRRSALPPTRERPEPAPDEPPEEDWEEIETPAEPAAPEPEPDRQRAFRAPPDEGPARALVDAPDSDAIVENGPIVAPDTVAGRSLTAVVAIMTFLCALLLGSAVIIERAASAWSATVLDDVSVTVLPLDGDPLQPRLEKAAALMRDTPGLSVVAILPAAQSEALLEPWLGAGTDLSLLPVPRLVTARRAGSFDAAALREALADVPGASLDDHSGWSERLSRMAASITGGALLALALMLGATAISIVFATRAAIATNAGTVEVLHILGAEDGFIVRAFRGRFLRIGLRGAAIGLAAALVLFGALETWSMLSAGAASRQSEALLGAPRIGPFGFVAITVLALLIAGLVTVTTSLAVRHHLKNLSR